MEPPIQGREDAGHTATSARNHPAPTTIPPSPPSSCPIRRRHGTADATRYTSANAGTTSSATPIFARKPSPMSSPHATSHPVPARRGAASTARTSA